MGLIPVVSLSSMKPMVPVGARTVTCALRNPFSFSFPLTIASRHNSFARVAIDNASEEDDWTRLRRCVPTSSSLARSLHIGTHSNLVECIGDDSLSERDGLLPDRRSSGIWLENNAFEHSRCGRTRVRDDQSLRNTPATDFGFIALSDEPPRDSLRRYPQPRSDSFRTEPPPACLN